MNSTNSNGTEDKLKLFVSYAHEDAPFLKRLKVHLARAIYSFGFEFWDDTRIDIGDNWAHEIEDALNNAEIVILLISADFLASNFIVNQELPKILMGQKKTGTRVIPVIISPCGFDDDPILSQFQALNPPDEYIAQYNKYKQDEYWDKLRRKVKKAIENILEERIEAAKAAEQEAEAVTAPSSNGKRRRAKK